MKKLCKNIVAFLLCTTVSAAKAQSTSIKKQIQPGYASIDVPFPTAYGVSLPTAGARVILTYRIAWGLHLQFARSEQEQFTAYGVTTELNYYLTPVRAFAPYLLGTFSLGQNRYDEPVPAEEQIKEELQLSTAVGFGVEVFLLDQLSTSVEVQFGGTILPSELGDFSTSTSQVELHYYFDTYKLFN